MEPPHYARERTHQGRRFSFFSLGRQRTSTHGLTRLGHVRFVRESYLAGRRHMQGILTIVLLMVDSGLPCFSRGDPIGNLRKRFHPEINEREAANFMIRTCMDAYNKWTTAGYDLIQYLQQGIEK